jgi:uncharacterized membrane protein YdjX (TVP38/TMEM64 family)
MVRKGLYIGMAGFALFEMWVFRDPLIASLRWFSDLDAIILSIKGYGAWGPAILFLLFILQTFLAFIPGQALMIASGYIYGFGGGILITWGSLVLGGQAAFWLARRYGRPFAEKFIAPNTLDRWDKSAAGQGILFYIVTLVMPFFPNDAMCYVAGLAKISSRRFLAANLLGRGIASFLTVFVGSFAGRIPWLIWVFVAGFILLGIVGLIAARR